MSSVTARSGEFRPRLPTPGFPRPQRRREALPAAPRLELVPLPAVLRTIQLHETDLMEDRAPCLVRTIQLCEADLVMLGLVADNPLAPLLPRAGATIDCEIHRVHRRPKVAVAAVLGLAGLLCLGLLVGGTGPVPGLDLPPVPAVTDPASAVPHSVLPAAARVVPAPADVAAQDPPTEAALAVEPARAPTARAGSSRVPVRPRPPRAVRRRAVDPDALLASAHTRFRRANVDSDALLASARTHSRLRRKTVDPFGE